MLRPATNLFVKKNYSLSCKIESPHSGQPETNRGAAVSLAYEKYMNA